jgi:hypothetical protein
MAGVTAQAERQVESRWPMAHRSSAVFPSVVSRLEAGQRHRRLYYRRRTRWRFVGSSDPRDPRLMLNPLTREILPMRMVLHSSFLDFLQLVQTPRPVVFEQPRQASIREQFSSGLAFRTVIGLILGIDDALHR